MQTYNNQGNPIMALNLLNDYALNDFLTDISFQGNPQIANQGLHGEFESVDYVVANRDTIVRGILNQYIKLRVRNYILAQENEPAFIPVKDSANLPDWAQTLLSRGEQVYQFNGAKMSDRLKNDITTVRDYLYDVATMYVDKVIKIAENTKQKPKIRYDYLKTTNEYNTFEQALSAAQEWHEKLAENLAKKQNAQQILSESLIGAEFVMNLPNNMTAYRLTTPEALDFESEYMGHCIGSGGYDKNVKNGTMQIYSIRDERGEPHATFEVRNNTIQQCKGKQNKAPVAKYMPAIQEFIKSKKFELGGDKKNTGLIEQDGEYYSILHLPRNFVFSGNLDLSNMGLTELPDMSTVTILGSFICYHNQLTSLTGAPKHVGGDFNCDNNQLTSLTGAPKQVGGEFTCNHNQLTSLTGAPENVGWNFYCDHNQLTSLIGAPKHVGGGFSCGANQLTSLIGAPENVGGNFYCDYNQLTSLTGVPKHVGGNFGCSHNQLTILMGVPKEVGGYFDCSYNQLTNLMGVPKEVGGKFDCSHNQLTSLTGAPENVSGNFDCSHNRLTRLTGAPKEVGGDFDGSHNILVTLTGAPEKIGGKILLLDGNPLTPENSKKNAFRQGIENIPTPTKEHTIIHFDDNHEI